ncbi:MULTISPECIES: xanthine dehydrogenase family protein subunit M [unclassified Pseudonocardia]|uniref:FAD binding domain-containing protein n=1 Tax=unclassified Pseudonocardia TaxID=2619320 RepID=UPI000959E45D|nr:MULTISPECIES: xanthine dehydrogenase family protein subunit M [unclassified Pseudonocardia]MBN9101348.1 xanthine dehydrogenase family protein subunit M [Pseudonocardia sp.]OJY42564.1 MAG: molybdopterin dehydrogenase [Pseudonocardia sp. 73-21]
MKPPPVKYARAGDVAEAVALLTEHGSDAKVLAGGQSLIPLMNFRLARPSVLIDINRAAGLDGIRVENGSLVIGAMARQRDVETSDVAAGAVPLLPQVLRHVGHVTNRNRGTVGGSLAHADPAAELPALVTGLGGELLVQGPGGSRLVAAEDYFLGTFTTAMEFDEVLTGVRLPRLPAGTGVAVEELARRHGDFAIVATMAAIHLAADGTVDLVRLAASGVASVPVRLHGAEAVLAGIAPTAEAIDAAAETVAGSIKPTGDVHAPADYRRDMAGLLVRRALRTAIQRTEVAA